ncbi:MAG: hypothetical protein CV088_12550 [Nitrospira sp. LK70]|nr:hypothetical protein [Nitrospira sp. LK70]
MSPVDEERLQKLEQALTEAHRARHIPSWQAGWVEDVMQEVRRVARRPPRACGNGDVVHLVWRAACFAAVLSIFLLVSFLMQSTVNVSEEGGLMAEDVEVGSLFFE